MLEAFTGARLTRDFEMRRRDGEVILIPAGTSCVVLDVYKSPPGYEMEFDYGGEEFSIGIPADIVERVKRDFSLFCFLRPFFLPPFPVFTFSPFASCKRPVNTLTGISGSSFPSRDE